MTLAATTAAATTATFIGEIFSCRYAAQLDSGNDVFANFFLKRFQLAL